MTTSEIRERDTFGLPLGKALRGREKYWLDFESTAIVFMGPRRGKTTGFVVPALMSAPGPVVLTSNKPDIVGYGKYSRGTKSWVFDPQSLSGAAPEFWWNPFSTVRDMEGAMRLANYFASSARGDGQKSDFWDQQAQLLLTQYLLACSLSGLPISTVAKWLADPGDTTAANILEQFPSQAATAEAVRGTLAAPANTRGGIFQTAAGMIACLTIPNLCKWVEFDPTMPDRPELNLHEFLNSRDTLLLLSREGVGSSAPLVLAIVGELTHAAEQYAALQPTERLPLPLTLLLDECANIVKMERLPDFFSHWGSRGIIPLVFLQSYTQGRAVWGDTGMKKMFSAANVRGIGGGLAEADFLQTVSQLTGDYYYQGVNASRGGRNESVSLSTQKEAILSVSDLAALPAGRVLLLPAGDRPTLAAFDSWEKYEYAPAVRASISRVKAEVIA